MLGLLAFLTLIPVTLPVPILRPLVHDRFAVSETLTSLFMSINMIGALLAAPLAGMLADRFGRRRELIVAALAADAACFALLSEVDTFPVFLTLRFFEGAAHIFSLSLLLALAATCQSEERRGRAMGICGAGMLLGVALGAPLGGALGAQGTVLPLRVGATVLIAAAVAAAWSLRETGERRQRPGFSEIAATVVQHPAVLIPLLFAFADRFTVGFYTTTLSLYLTRIHAATPGQIGALIAAFMLPFALLSYPFGRLSEGRSLWVMLCAGSVFYGIGTALVGCVSLAELSLLMPLIGAAAAVMFVPTLVMTARLVPPAVSSTALGAFNAAGSLGFIAGPLCGGLISQGVAASCGWPAGYRSAFAFAGLTEIACVVLALATARRWGASFD